LPNSVFGPNGLPYFFTEATNGHLTSTYPIGTAIISFPLYVIFFIYLKLAALWQGGLDLSSLSINIVDPSFNDQRKLFEKLAGSVLTASAVVIFYLLIRLKFNRAIAWITTFIYAFATLNWMIASQGLWQHTASNLALVSTMLCLFKANRTEGKRQITLLVIAGIFRGLLLGIRSTSLVFAIAILAYAILTYRYKSIFVILGSSSALINFAWNIHHFGSGAKSLSGGYSQHFNTHLVSYDSQFNSFVGRFLGLLVSPNRGFFIFSPILLFALPGAYAVFKRRSHPDERLIEGLLLACLVLFFQYTVYEGW
jgi:hypothetical protein